MDVAASLVEERVLGIVAVERHGHAGAPELGLDVVEPLRRPRREYGRRGLDSVTTTRIAEAGVSIGSLMDGWIDEHAADPPELHELLAQHPPAVPGLRLALRNIIASRDPSSDGGSRFVVPGLMDVLAHEAVLSRPTGLSMAAARAEAARAVVSCLTRPGSARTP